MKIFIFLVGIGWDWGILGSNNRMNWWDINPPFMYCVFHHISDHLQRLILFWQFYKKVGLRSDPPPPGWSKRPSLSKEKIFGAPLRAGRDILLGGVGIEHMVRCIVYSLGVEECLTSNKPPPLWQVRFIPPLSLHRQCHYFPLHLNSWCSSAFQDVSEIFCTTQLLFCFQLQ